MSTPSGCKDIRIRKFNLVGLTTDKMFYKKKGDCGKKVFFKIKARFKKVNVLTLGRHNSKAESKNKQ